MGSIFAGLLFVFLHFRINGFDLLPDFVGYLLIWRGMRSVQESEWWQNNRSAMAMCVISGIMLFAGGAAGTILGLAAMALQLMVLYDIARGVRELEEYTGSDMQAGELRKSFLFAAICSILAYVSGWVWAAAAVAPTVLAFAGILCYMVYCFKAWKAFEVWREEQRTAV